MKDKTEVITLDQSQCPIDQVNVYSDRAMIKRIVKTGVPQGNVDIVIKNLSKLLDFDSLSVSGRGGAAILEVSYKTDYLDTPKVDVDQLTRDIESLNKQIKGLEKAIARNNKIKNFMVNFTDRVMDNKKKPDTDILVNSDTLMSFTKFVAFRSKQLTTIETDAQELDRKLRDARDTLARKTELKYQNGGNISQGQLCSKQVTVSINAKKECDIELLVTYMVPQASWTPSYDLRARSSDPAHVELSYYGLIQQNTGEDWKNASVSLSTALPSLGGTVPKLETLYVNYSYGGGGGQHKQPILPGSNSSSSYSKSVDYDGGKGHAVARSEKGLSGSTFHIPRAANIPSDNSPHKVTIANCELGCSLAYYIVPSTSTSCYIRMSCVNNTDYTFLAGNCSVFYDNAFITKTTMKSVSTTESFDVFVGVDADIKVEYKPIKKVSETKSGVLKSSNVLKVDKRTIVKNAKTQPINVIVVEPNIQTTDQRIHVQVSEPNLNSLKQVSDAIIESKKPKRAQLIQINDQMNLEWHIPLAAGETVEVPLQFSVEWPHGMRLDNTF